MRPICPLKTYSEGWGDDNSLRYSLHVTIKLYCITLY